jgi:hypothetical protein
MKEEKMTGYRLKMILQRNPGRNIAVPQALTLPVPPESMASAAQTWLRSHCTAPTMMDVAQSLIVAENVLRYDRDSDRVAACGEAFGYLTMKGWR